MAAAVFSTDLTEILTQAAEAAAGLAGIYNGFQILDLARDYYNLYKKQREFYYNTFHVNVEAPLSQDIYNDPRPVLDYAATVRTAYDTAAGPFGGNATDVLGWWMRHASAYGEIPDSRLLKEMATEIQRIKTDWTNYFFRFAENQYDLNNDIRWKKRMALHNIGIKQGTSVSSALGNALGEYQNQLQDFGSQLATYGNGIAAQVGYKKGLADTSDDFNSMGYQTKVNVPDYNYVQIGVMS